MLDKSPNNSRISSYLRFVTGVECFVVFAAAVGLFLFPALAAKFWAWEIPPFNSRFVGAVYFSALLPLIVFWSSARWTPGRLVLWMIFVFTGLVMVAMIVHWDIFIWSRVSSYGFWLIYIFLPINSAIFLYKSRGEQLVGGLEVSTLWKIILFIFALLFGIYGLGLLLAPESFTNFWPWPVDNFHARMYASAFITPAVAAWILWFRRGAASEYLTFGLNLLAGGFFSILGTLWTNANVPAERQINFGASGTWAFFILFFITGILGIALILFAIQNSKKTPT
jgi:hypothetical protein